ncbi:MAG: CbiX/SirB N-terminal domain-containing protein [Myxococcaceae bacterium]
MAFAVLAAWQASAEPTPKTAVLLVSHGSRSAAWREGLVDLEHRVTPSLKKLGIAEVQTAFMEYTEPSIATRLKALDGADVTDVILVPVFLTVSPHSFDDIPTIIGKKEDAKSLQVLKLESIERYSPKARVTVTPLLDFSGLLKTNVLRRARSLSRDPSQEGLVLIAYGDSTYEKEWTQLLESVGSYVREQLGVNELSVGWCGHLVHYAPEKTTEAVERVLTHKSRALVVPVLVAFDEMFQVKIIGGGIEKVEDRERRVAYRPDAILPDPDVEAWVVRIAGETLQKLGQTSSVTP